MNQIVQIFKALGDENRLRILLILSKRRVCAKGIAKKLGITEAAVSQHIKVLKEADIIVGRKVGYYVCYDLKENTIMDISEFAEKLVDTYGKSNGNETLMPHECRASCKSKNRCCRIK